MLHTDNEKPRGYLDINLRYKIYAHTNNVAYKIAYIVRSVRWNQKNISSIKYLNSDNPPVSIPHSNVNVSRLAAVMKKFVSDGSKLPFWKLARLSDRTYNFRDTCRVDNYILREDHRRVVLRYQFCEWRLHILRLVDLLLSLAIIRAYPALIDSRYSRQSARSRAELLSSEKARMSNELIDSTHDCVYRASVTLRPSKDSNFV